MKILILLTLFFAHPPIEWRKLTFSDFKGKAPDNIWAAQTSTFLEYSIIGKDEQYYFTVIPYFDPDESYLTTVTDSVLFHEQLHFDIAEIFSRYAQKVLKEYQGTNRIEEARKEYDFLDKEWKAVEVLFDTETDHGRNRYMEEKWQVKIRDELAHWN
jgi:hypothetical protein